MRIYPQFILWTYVLLPVICLLLSPTIILSIVKAQQERAKLMANAMNARAKAASALARNQARMQQRNLMQNGRFSNGMSQKPFRFRTTRDIPIPEEGVPFIEEIHNSDLFRKRNWDQQDETLAQLQNMWNMNNFGATQHEGVLRRSDMNRDQLKEWQQPEEMVTSPRIYDKKKDGSIAATGPFFGRNVYDDVVKQEAPFIIEPIFSESFSPERFANPEPTSKKKKKLQKMPLSFYYPQGSYGSYNPGSYYARSNDDETPFVEQQIQERNIMDDHQMLGESVSMETLANPDPTFKKKKKKFPKQPPSFYYPQINYYDSYYPSSSYYARSNDDPLSQFVESEHQGHGRDNHQILGAEDPHHLHLVTSRQNDEAGPFQERNNEEMVEVAHFDVPEGSWLAAEHLTGNRQDISSYENPDQIHELSENFGSRNKDHNPIIIIEDITEVNNKDNAKNEHLLPSSTPASRLNKDMLDVGGFVPKESLLVDHLRRNEQDVLSSLRLEHISPDHLDIGEHVPLISDDVTAKSNDTQSRNHEDMTDVALVNDSEEPRLAAKDVTENPQNGSSSENQRHDHDGSDVSEHVPLISKDVTPQSNNTQRRNHEGTTDLVTLVNDSEEPGQATKNLPVNEQGGLPSENQEHEHDHTEVVGEHVPLISEDVTPQSNNTQSRNHEGTTDVTPAKDPEEPRQVTKTLTGNQQDGLTSENQEHGHDHTEVVGELVSLISEDLTPQSNNTQSRNHEGTTDVVTPVNDSEELRQATITLTENQQDGLTSENQEHGHDHTEVAGQQVSLITEGVTPTQIRNHEDTTDVTLVNDSEEPRLAAKDVTENPQDGSSHENQAHHHGHSEDVGCELDENLFENKADDLLSPFHEKSADPDPDPHHHSHGLTHAHSHVHSHQKNFGNTKGLGVIATVTPNVYGSVYPQTQTHGGIGTTFSHASSKSISHGHAPIGLHLSGAQSQIPGLHTTLSGQSAAHAGGFGHSSASAQAATQNLNGGFSGFNSGNFGQASSGSFNRGGFGQSSANAQNFNSGAFGPSSAQVNAQSFNRGGFGQSNAQAQAAQGGQQFFQVLAPTSFVNARANDEIALQSSEDSFVTPNIPVRDVLLETERENNRSSRQSVFDGLNLASSIVHSTLDQSPSAHQHENRKSNDGTHDAQDTMAFVTGIVDASLKADNNPNEAFKPEKEHHKSFHPTGNIEPLDDTFEGISSISDIVNGNIRNRRQVDTKSPRIGVINLNVETSHGNDNLGDIDKVASNNDTKDILDVAMTKSNSNEIASEPKITKVETSKKIKEKIKPYRKPNIEDEMIEMTNPEDPMTTEPLTTESFITFKKDFNKTLIEMQPKEDVTTVNAMPQRFTEPKSCSDTEDILHPSSQSKTNSANPTELQSTEKPSSNASTASNIKEGKVSDSKEDAGSKSEESSEERGGNMGTTEKVSITTSRRIQETLFTKPIEIDKRADVNITEQEGHIKPEIPVKPFLANDDRDKVIDDITEGNFNNTAGDEISTLSPDEIEDIQFTIPDNATSIIDSTKLNNNTNQDLAKPILNKGEHGDDKEEPIVGMSLNANVGKETPSRQNTSKIVFNPSGAPFDSIEAEMSVLTDEEKDEFIRQEIELITEVIEETLKQDFQLNDVMNEKNKTHDANPEPANNVTVSSPHLFQALYHSTDPENYQRHARSASPVEAFDSILGAQKERLDNIQKEATDDGDLLMISFIGDSVIKDLEDRRENFENQSAETPSVRRTKRALNPQQAPIKRLVNDPNTKINMPKTLENVGSVLRHTFENPRAPMYHVRSMLGNTKNTLMSAAKVPPNNILLPSQYEIARLGGNKDANRRLGEINNKMLFARSGPGKLEEEQEDSLGIVDTFQKIGGMVKESVQNGKNVVEHVNDAATDARNVIYTAKHATPRLIVPDQTPRSPLDVAANILGKKAILITPRVVDVQENMVGAEEESPEHFIGLGKIFDSVGLSQPNQPEMDLERIILEPRRVDVMKQWDMPQVTRSPSILKAWVKDSSKKDTITGAARTDVQGTLESLHDAEQSVGAKNLKEFFNRMHQEMKEILTSQHEERKKKRKEKTKMFRKDRKLSKKKSFQKPVQKSDAILSAVNYDRIIDENTDATLPPEILQIFSDNPEYKSSSQENPNIKTINSRMQKVTPPNNLDTASNEDEKLGLNLAPELMKPFMGQPAQDVLDNFMRENDNDFKEAKVYPVSPLNRNIAIPVSGPFKSPMMVGEQMPREGQEEFVPNNGSSLNVVDQTHFVSQGVAEATTNIFTANRSPPPLVGKQMASSNFNYYNDGSSWTPQQTKHAAGGTNGQPQTRYLSKTNSKTKHLNKIHQTEDLGHVLGAMNPMMFERFYNESLKVNNFGPNKFNAQQTGDNEADMVALAAETENETRMYESAELPNKSLKLHQIQDTKKDETFMPRKNLELQDAENGDNEVLPNTENEAETSFANSTGRTSMKIFSQYQKPFMGLIKHDRIHEYLNQYNNNIAEDEGEPVITVEAPDYEVPIKSIVFSNEDDEYNFIM